jgi:hypothetical protein
MHRFKLTVNRLASVTELWYTPRQGYYPGRLTRIFKGKIQIWEYPRREKNVKRRMPSEAIAGKVAPQHLAAVETNVMNTLPNLVSHCCVTRYDDGTARRPGWWTVKTQGTTWIVQVKDPDGCCGLSAMAQSLDDALALADLLLGADDAPWEPDPFLADRRPGKKK